MTMLVRPLLIAVVGIRLAAAADVPIGPAGRPGMGGLVRGINDPARIANRVADIVLVTDSLVEIAKATPARRRKRDSGSSTSSRGTSPATRRGGMMSAIVRLRCTRMFR